MEVRRFVLAVMMVFVTGGWAAAQPATDDVAPVMQAQRPVAVIQAQRPAALIPLYLSQAALQGADLYTTRRALNAGHIEANPVFKDASFGTMVGAKIAATAASIYLSEKLWKRNRYAAIGVMVAANIGMSAVVANNYRVLQK